jgi:polygalacturonase
MFLCNPSDTTSDNGGTIIPDGHGNRWYRQTEGRPYSAKWFGAKGDGTTDDRDAIQAAITTVERLPVGGTVWLPAGKYRITAPLRITASLTLLGAGNQTINGATRIAPTFMDRWALSAVEVVAITRAPKTRANSFVQTLVLTDIATGWTECAPLLVREQRLLTEVLGELRKLLPFPLLGLDTESTPCTC